jgi:hypothetical protein
MQKRMNINQQKLHTYAKNTHQKFTLMFYLHFEQKNNQNVMMKKHSDNLLQVCFLMNLFLRENVIK